jgi:hypothetical protein
MHGSGVEACGGVYATMHRYVFASGMLFFFLVLYIFSPLIGSDLARGDIFRMRWELEVGLGIHIRKKVVVTWFLITDPISNSSLFTIFCDSKNRPFRSFILCGVLYIHSVENHAHGSR